MSKQFPIVAVTGSSGAGTTEVRKTFESIFKKLNITAAIVEGDSYHKYERDQMRQLADEWERTAGRGISHFGPEANLFQEMEKLFKNYGEKGSGISRIYLHNEEKAAKFGQKAGTFTPWMDIPSDTDLLFYEGLHGGVHYQDNDMAKHVDLLIGVTPTINLEWIQKINRDINFRGHSMESIINTILRRMDDYVYYIVPQFSKTHINFQRVPMVDTSNPFDETTIPGEEESFIVIRFRKRVDTIEYQDLLDEIPGFMTRKDTIVVPGENGGEAMKIILTPRIQRLIQQSKNTFKNSL